MANLFSDLDAPPARDEFELGRAAIRGRAAKADRAALAVLAASSRPRAELSGPFIAVCKSSDLFAHGYSVLEWLNPRTREHVVEYNPRFTDLPRVTAETYAAQVAIHRALGAPVLPPAGERRRPDATPPLELPPCDPPGTVSTAIDVDLLAEPSPSRFCGFCATDLTDVRLGQLCPKCRHRLGWFQLLAVGGLADSPASEEELAEFIAAYRAKYLDDEPGGELDGPDDDTDF